MMWARDAVARADGTVVPFCKSVEGADERPVRFELVPKGLCRELAEGGLAPPYPSPHARHCRGYPADEGTGGPVGVIHGMRGAHS